MIPSFSTDRMFSTARSASRRPLWQSLDLRQALSPAGGDRTSFRSVARSREELIARALRRF